MLDAVVDTTVGRFRKGQVHVTVCTYGGLVERVSVHRRREKAERAKADHEQGREMSCLITTEKVD